MESTQNPPTPTPDQVRAITALNALLADGETVVFRAWMEQPSREFYLISAHYLLMDMTILVANAIGEPLYRGRFRISIKELLDRLSALGAPIDNYQIVETDEEPDPDESLPEGE